MHLEKCNAQNPVFVARSNCGLTIGHIGPHRSVMEWENEPACQIDGHTSKANFVVHRMTVGAVGLGRYESASRFTCAGHLGVAVMELSVHEDDQITVEVIG